MPDHPYVSLPQRNFWRTAISQLDPLHWSAVYRKRFVIDSETRISTAGSCFAQHIGRQLKARNFRFVDVEPPPSLLPQRKHADYGYGLFSARYGNVYTARQLLQLLLRAINRFQPLTTEWEHDGRFFDPFRPTIEPNGFGSIEELTALRTAHLKAVLRLIKCSDVFIFTLGLTEAWTSVDDGAVYPICPGISAGRFDPQQHTLHNFSYPETVADLEAFFAVARTINPELRFLLTVSPVPLTATATDQHVLTATTYSKSVLRAVAGDLYRAYDFVDYFPSYEIITAPAAKGVFFASNQREVTPAGVDAVMGFFFSEHSAVADTHVQSRQTQCQSSTSTDEEDQNEFAAACDEQKLDEFLFP
jgi:hypothetical protein